MNVNIYTILHYGIIPEQFRGQDLKSRQRWWCEVIDNLKNKTNLNYFDCNQKSNIPPDTAVK